MHLTDIIPLTAEELFRIQHEYEETKEELAARKARLEPFSKAFLMCLRECGPLTDDPKNEYCIHMSALALIDIFIQEYTKKNVV